MTDVPSGSKGYPGQQTPFDDKSEFAKHKFMVESLLARANHATLAVVKKVKSKGEVAAPGKIDVQPLVKTMDGKGNTFSHGVVNNVIYFRLQAGDKAVIMDPKPGDIGILISADRDISTVKNTRKESNPGSFRRNNIADSMFFPCFLGDTPKCYVRFTDDDKVEVSPDSGTTVVRVEKDKISLITSSLAAYVRPSRIDLGMLNAPHAVLTVDGPSLKVFAVIAENGP